MSDHPPEFDPRDASAVIQAFEQGAAALRDSPLREHAVVTLPPTGRLVVSGDLHDHRLNFDRVVKLARLEEADTNHLLLQEVIHGEDRLNGMDLSIRILARCAHLASRYPGRVHVLQSNHELAQLTEEPIVKDGQSVVESFDQGIDYLYGNAADDVRDAMKTYLGSLLLAVRTNPPDGSAVVMLHSLPSPRRIEAFDKTILDRDPTEADLAPRGSGYDLVWGRYQNRTILDELAEAWGVGAFILGHQPDEMGWQTKGDNALIITSEHDHGQAVVLDLSRGYGLDDLTDALKPLAAVRVG